MRHLLFIAVLLCHICFCAKAAPGFHRPRHASGTVLAPRHARAWYLDTSGDDANDGSITHPWKTLQKLNSQPLRPGDSLLFRGGQSFGGTLKPENGGSSLHPVSVGSYGSKEPATIDGGDSAAMVLYHVGHVHIRYLRLTGNGRKTGNTKDGLLLVESHDIRLDRIEVSGFQKSGLFIYSSVNITASHVNAHDNGSAGISVEGGEGKKDSRNIRILDCRAENNPGDPTNLTNHSGNGIVAGHCTNLLIDRCTATNNGWDMPRIGNGPVGIWCYEADSVIIQHCLSYRNKTSVGGADGGGFDLDGGVTHSIVQYNLSYENQGSGYCIFQYWGASPWHDNIFRYNISENDGLVSDSRAGLYVWNSSGDAGQFRNCLVYNNTIFNDKEAAISYSEKSERKDFAFYNNIFVSKDSLIRGGKGKDTFLGNAWWSLNRQFKGDGLNLDPAFKTPGKTALTSASTQPLASFDVYKVPARSPLRNGGIDVHRLTKKSTGGIDFNGRPAPVQGIGASF
jgi:hypothetical protein